MRHSLLMKLGALAAAGSTLLVPATALADGPDLTLRIEPGVAVPLTQPQSRRFDPGADLTLKPSIGLTPWLDGSVVLSGMVLPSRLNGIDPGTVFGVGLGLRVKRPHDLINNTGSGFTAVSPWVDADAQVVGTGPLARSMFSLGLGASVPTSSARNLWIGPFVRYADVVESLSDRVPLVNNNDAHVFIAGISIEIGPKAAKRALVEVHLASPPEPVVVVAPIPQPAIEPIPELATVTVHEIVQFPFDSATPIWNAATGNTLQETITYLKNHPDTAVEVRGFASSEGQAAYNDKLSLRRAQAVAALLVHNGVASNRITAKGFGSRNPVAPNDTEVNRAKNRRVEFSVDVVITRVVGPAGAHK